MAEGDTVFATAAQLHGALAGRVLTRSDLRVPRFATTDLSGQRVLAVAPRGKHLLLRTDRGLTVHSHLGMDGSWRLYELGERWRGRAFEVRAVLFTEDRIAVGHRLRRLEVIRTSTEARLLGRRRARRPVRDGGPRQRLPIRGLLPRRRGPAGPGRGAPRPGTPRRADEDPDGSQPGRRPARDHRRSAARTRPVGLRARRQTLSPLRNGDPVLPDATCQQGGVRRPRTPRHVRLPTLSALARKRDRRTGLAFAPTIRHPCPGRSPHRDRPAENRSDRRCGGELVEEEPAPTLTGLDPERLFAAAPEPLLVVRDDRIELANDQAAAFLGCDPVGLDIHEVIPEWVEGADAGVPFEASLRSPVGGELPGEVRVRRLDPSTAIVAIHDARAVIAGREAEAALTEAEARYRSLVEQIPAVVYADDGDITTYVSPQIQQILGVTPEEYRADPGMWLRMVHPDDRAQVEAESEAFLVHGSRLDETLRDVSNPDKHRKLTVTATHIDSTFKLAGGEPGSSAGRPGKVFSGVGRDDADVHVEGEATLDNQFPDEGLPVIETLKLLKSHVAETIESFKPEFKA